MVVDEDGRSLFRREIWVVMKDDEGEKRVDWGGLGSGRWGEWVGGVCEEKMVGGV